MLFVALALLPIWQILPPAEFRAWFKTHSRRIGTLMFPLGTAAVVASLLALIRERSDSDLLHWTAFLAASAVGIVTLAVNEPANARFAAVGGLSDPETRALLARWKAWHWVRVGFGLVAFVAALGTLGPSPP
jgi:hypothetical protein